MKTCTKCGETKPLDGFHASPMGAGGRTSACKTCRKAAAAEYNKLNRTAIIEKTRAYREAHPDDVKRWARERYRRDPAATMQAQREARAREPNKAKARSAVDKAVAAGRLVKPSACTACGTGGVPLDGHHESYERDRWLDVQWMCRRCHLRVHGERKAA